MDRLTWVDWHGCVLADTDDVEQIEYECGVMLLTGNIVHKLAEYEDTALTPDEVKSLLKQQIPKKLTCASRGRVSCGRCSALIPAGIGKISYCVDCGQKLDWNVFKGI